MSQVALAFFLFCSALALWCWTPGPGRLTRLTVNPAPAPCAPGSTAPARKTPIALGSRSERRVPVVELLLVMELLADALDAGAPPVAALETVAASVTGALSPALRQAAHAMRLGADARSAWRDVSLAGPGRPLADLARAMSRVDEGGARVAGSLRRLAIREAERAHGRALAAARRAGVLAVAPLGFCFLPAFVLLAVVPVVAGAAHQVLVP